MVQECCGRVSTAACTDYIHPGEIMNTTESDTTTPSNPTTEAAACKSKCASCCGPHTSLIVAGIAIVIAVYALVTGPNHTADMQVQDRLTNIEEQVTSINTQLNQLGADVQSNRENLIHTKLQKALENVQEIGDMATTATRAKLAEIETMLHEIISPASEEAAVPEDFPVSPDTEAAPDEAPAADATAPAEAAPADETTPETSAQDAPAEPATAPADSTVTPEDAPAATPDAAETEEPVTKPQAF